MEIDSKAWLAGIRASKIKRGRQNIWVADDAFKKFRKICGKDYNRVLELFTLIFIESSESGKAIDFSDFLKKVT